MVKVISSQVISLWYTRVLWYIEYTVRLHYDKRECRAESNVKRDAGPAGFEASVGQARTVRQIGFIVVVICLLPPMTYVSRPRLRSEAHR